MPSAIVADSASKEVIPLKAIQPTQLWSFDNALSLLKSDQDRYIEDALDEFLLLNKQLLLNADPFSGSDANFDKDVKEIALRNILYSNITPSNISDSQLISKTTNMNAKEVVRVISQTCQMFPEKKYKIVNNFKSKLPDDGETHLKNERQYLYISKILKERRIILKIAIELLNNKTNYKRSETIQNLGKEIFMSTNYINSLIDTIKRNIDLLISQGYLSDSDQLSDLIYIETVLYTIELHKVLVEILLQNPTITNQTMENWFKLVETNNFILSLGPYINFQESFDLLKSLATIISLLFLDLDNSFDSDSNTNFLSDPVIFKSINDCICHTSNENSIVLYSWSIILLRKYIYLSEVPNPEFTKIYSLTQMNKTIEILSAKCEILNVFRDLKSLNDLLRFDNIYSAILSTVITAAIPLISLDFQISNSISNILANAPNSIIEKFFNYETSINAIVLARAKFPLSLIPYLELASINGNFALQEISEFKSYMSLFKKDEFAQLYKFDDENSELVKLIEPIDLYPPFELNKKLSLLLGVDTKAKILPGGNNDQVLVSFLYKYNGWAFLGRVLQNISKLFSNSDQEKMQLTITIIKLMNKVVEDCDQENVREVLNSMSAYTDDSDILEVVLRLLEQGLHSRDVDVSEAILNLLTNLVPLFPQRILPYMSKSSLLSNNGKDGFASTFFGAIEIVNGEFRFTVALIKFTEALVQNFLGSNNDYPSKSKSIILTKFIKHLINVFESFSHNRFNRVFQKLEVGVLILDTFSSILAYVFGIDEQSKPTERVTRVLAEAAETILQSFVVSSNELPRSSIPLLGMIDSLSQNLNVYEVTDISCVWHLNWIKCAFAFCRLTIRIRSSLDLKVSSLEKQIFRRLPQLVLIYSQYHVFKKDVADLITTLTNAKWNSEPKASLLSHLGRDNAQVLLHSLVADLDNNFNDYSLKISLYDFICSVLDGDQQGLAVLFVSGRDVFGDFTKEKGGSKDNCHTTSVLSILKKNVRDLQYLPNEVSIHLLDAIALAFNSWTTVRENSDDNEFINDLINRLQISINELPASADEYISSCYELKLVGKIAEILALFLFTTKNTEIQNNIIKLIISKDFAKLLKERFSIKGHRPNLSFNSQLTFQNTFKNFKLSDFTVTPHHRNRFAVEGIYNLELMDKLFQKEDDWLQSKEQIIATSVNEQYIIAQISVAKPLGALIVSFSRRFSDRVEPSMLDLAISFLQMNINEGIPSEIFLQIFEERLQISFYVIYSLFNKPEVRKNTKRMFEILKLAVELLSTSCVNYFESLAQLSLESAVNYRPLLRIIFCSMNLLKDDASIVIEYFSVFRQIFDIVICKSTRTLLTEFQNEVYLSRNTKDYNSSLKMNSIIDDLLLIMSILKIFVDMNSYANLYHEIAVMIDENGTIKALLNLYSLSHEIEVNHEYIFARLSLMYIQELMKVEAIAAKFVESGLFVVLVESPISSPIRAGGVNVATGAQYHNLWINGILPLIITTLYQIGPNVLPEVSLAIQFFGKQTEFCIQSWEKDSSSIRITTATIAETSQILLLFDILKSMNATEYLQSQNSHSQTKSQLEDGEVVDMSILPGIDSESKRENFVNKVNNLLKHPKFLTTRIQPSSIEEHRIIEMGDASYDQFVKSIIDDIRDIKDFIN
jgi:nuclear pore complex protein Nup188